MQLQGRVAVVTGGSGGLGRRICHKLAEQGAHVVIVYRQGAQQAEDVASELRQSATGQTVVIDAGRFYH